MLILFFVSVAFYLEAAQPCFADRGAIGLGSTFTITDLPDEIAAQISVTTNMLNLAGQTSYHGTPYATHNLYGADTTTANILWAASACNHLCGIVFYVVMAIGITCAFPFHIMNRSGT